MNNAFERIALIPGVVAAAFVSDASKLAGWCANSVIAMNGKIHATSDGAGLGATFHLLLPAAPQRAEGRTQAA